MSIRTEFNPQGTLGGGSPLPPGWTRVLCIVSPQTASVAAPYIDTGIQPGPETKWELDVAMLTSGYNGALRAGYCRFTASFHQPAESPSESRIELFSRTSYLTRPTAVGERVKTTIDMPGRVCSIGDTEKAIVDDPATFDAPFPIFIGIRNNGGFAEFAISEKIYGSRIWERGELVQDLVPAIAPDGEVCMYDMVTGAKFPRKGSGTFGYETL